MILTAALKISKTIGATWSWWLLATAYADYSFGDNFKFRLKIERE